MPSFEKHGVIALVIRARPGVTKAGSEKGDRPRWDPPTPKKHFLIESALFKQVTYLDSKQLFSPKSYKFACLIYITYYDVK